MTEQAKILIVDDTPANLLFLRALLSKLDVEVVSANSGDEALMYAQEDDFALFLLDVNMPQMDGFALAKKLLSLGADSVPIVFITADRVLGEDRLKGYESGAVDYIQKPIQETELLSKIDIFLKIWIKSKELELALEEIAAKNIELQADAAKRKQMQDRLDKMAMYDELTQLPNRVLLKKESHKIIAAAERYKQKVGFMFVDLDGFKAVNDNHGHKTGDLVLVEVALRLQDVIRDIDVVGRFGGDEFIVILPNCSVPKDVEEIAKRILSAINKPLESVQIEEKLGASIGVSMYPNDGLSYDDLVGLADKMMYRSKDMGKNCYNFYSK